MDILALAGDSSYSDMGQIKLSADIGFTDKQIAGMLSIPLKQWQHIKQRLIETNRISANNNNVIHIINWAKYQSEYERQKPYRKKEGTLGTLGTLEERREKRESKNITTTNNSLLQPEVTKESDKGITNDNVFTTWEKWQLLREGDIENLNLLIDDYGEDEVIKAIEKAGKQGAQKVNIAYIEGIIKHEIEDKKGQSSPLLKEFSEVFPDGVK